MGSIATLDAANALSEDLMLGTLLLLFIIGMDVFMLLSWICSLEQEKQEEAYELADIDIIEYSFENFEEAKEYNGVTWQSQNNGNVIKKLTILFQVHEVEVSMILMGEGKADRPYHFIGSYIPTHKRQLRNQIYALPEINQIHFRLEGEEFIEAPIEREEIQSCVRAIVEHYKDLDKQYLAELEEQTQREIDNKRKAQERILQGMKIKTPPSTALSRSGLPYNMERGLSLTDEEDVEDLETVDATA